MCRSLSRFISCVSHHHLPRSERCRSDRNKSHIRCRQRIQPKRTHTKRNMKKMTDFRVIISAKEKKVRFFYRIHDIRSDEKFVLFLTPTSTTKWSNVERRNVIFMKRKAKKMNIRWKQTPGLPTFRLSSSLVCCVTFILFIILCTHCIYR